MKAIAEAQPNKAIDDAHDPELVTFYDKENLVIVVGNLFPNIGEFRMCFKTYTVVRVNCP
jgi:hypothetical protein